MLQIFIFIEQFRRIQIWVVMCLHWMSTFLQASKHIFHSHRGFIRIILASNGPLSLKIFCLVISEEVRGACAGFYVIHENQHSRVILSGSFPTITKISTWAKIQSYSPSYQIKTRLSFVGINSSPRCDWKNLHPVQFMGIATEWPKSLHDRLISVSCAIPFITCTLLIIQRSN